MGASLLHLFQPSVSDESEISMLITNYFLPDRVVLQGCPAFGEGIPTRYTKEILVFTSLLHRDFGLPACDFLRGILSH
jgi:hypothetical protein